MNEFGWTLHEVTPEESEFAEAYTNMDVGPTERILLDPTPGPRTFNGVIKAVHADVMVEIMSHFRSVKCLGDETFFWTTPFSWLNIDRIKVRYKPGTKPTFLPVARKRHFRIEVVFEEVV